MKRIFLSSLMVLAVAGAAVGATTAYFSDVETSTGNTFTAGAIDLTIDNSAWYNGVFQPSMSWTRRNLTIENFFNLLDVKPGDWEEDTISIHVDSNPAWACMDIKLTSNDDVDSTEPELGDGDSSVDTGLFDGELAQNIESIWWADDGDNVLEVGEPIIKQGTLYDLRSTSIRLADSTGNIWSQNGGPIPGAQTKFIGKAFCFGKLTPTPIPGNGGQNPGLATGFTCDGSLLDNTTQSDKLKADLSFFAVQSRNNPNFKCAPGEIGCLGVADVMLVMDRSGSIDAGELTTMKTAANAFVTALAPSASGIHMGLVSFSGTNSGPLTDASMDQRLTSNGASVQTAINNLSAGGLTNLYAGLALAADELEATSTPNTYSGLDRADVSSPDIVVVLTDGNPNVPGVDVAMAKALAKDAADEIKLSGAKIYVVGIGADVDATYLTNDISSGVGYYFPAATFGDLQAILAGIANCSND